MRHAIYIKFLLFAFCFSMLGGSLRSQILNFEQLSLKDGLPATECYQILQDKQGYIWVFTEFGIVKHNGAQFIPVCTNIPLKDQNAYAIFQTTEGEIFFANSFCKIFSIRNDSAFSIKAIEEFTTNFTKPENIIFQIIVDKNRDLYFCSYEASYCYHPSTNKVEQLLNFSENYQRITRYKFINGSFFSLQTHTLQKEKCDIQIIDEKKVIESKLYLESYYERRCVLKVDDSYFLTSSDFVYKISQNGTVHAKKIEGIVGMLTDMEKQIWVCTKNGLILLNYDLEEVANYLEDKVVSNLCFDNKGGVWATTIGQGVFYCKSRKEIAYANTDLKNKEIFFIKKGNNGFYLSSVDGMCYKYSDGSFDPLHTFENKSFCGDITAYKDGYLLSTKKGLFFKSKNGILKELEDKAGGSLYSNYVRVLNDDEFLSFGGSSIDHFGENRLLYSCSTKYKIYCVTYFDPHHYLVGTKKGIFIFDHTTNSIKVYNDFFANKCIMSIVYDLDGNLWIGTRGDGLYAINLDQQVIEYTDVPFSVVKDIDFADDKVIVSTNLGVYVNSSRGTRITGDWISIFDYEINAVEVIGDDLWIASRNGLYSMSFSNLVSTDFYPVIINSVYSGSKRVLDHSSELNYSENDLRFNFDFLNYRSEVKNFYFGLDGPTKLSGTINGNVLQIQNLDPGNYKLSVYPYHGPAYSNKHFITTSFILKPAFWQTYWFKPGLFILAILISGGTVGLFYNSKRKRDKKKAEINKLLAEYKLTALKAQINPHFISNSLSAIQLLIDSGKVDKANQYIAKFSLLIRYVLKYSDKSVSRLSDELKIIELNVDLEQLRFTNSFAFKLDVASDIDINELYVPPLITQPFIENAIWHGLIPLTSRIPKLILKIKKQDDSLIISIIDNGVGRKRSEKNTTITNNAFRDSMGTKLIQNRIDNLNAMHNTKAAEVMIKDLYDEQSNPAGTQVDIILSVSLLSNF